MAAVGAILAAVAKATMDALMGAVFLVQAIDGAVKDQNAKKANAYAKELDILTNKYNISQQALDDALEKANLNYNRTMENLQYVTRNGAGYKARSRATKNIQSLTDKTLKAKQTNTAQYNTQMEYLSAQQRKYENRGVLDEIGITK